MKCENERNAMKNDGSKSVQSIPATTFSISSLNVRIALQVAAKSNKTSATIGAGCSKTD